MDTKQPVVDATTSAQIVTSLSDKLRAYYVFPDVAEQICLLLEKRLSEGHITILQKANVWP